MKLPTRLRGCRDVSRGAIVHPYFCWGIRHPRSSRLSSHKLFSQVLEIWSQPREPLGVRALVAGGAETDGVKTCSGFGHRLLSGVGHRSYVGH
jgi:hypothetical protein